MLDSPIVLEEFIMAIKNSNKQPFGIDFTVITFIKENIKRLIEVGVVNLVDNSAQCVQCGKECTIFLTIKNDDSTALCLDCAYGLEFNQNLVINAVMKDKEIKCMSIFG